MCIRCSSVNSPMSNDDTSHTEEVDSPSRGRGRYNISLEKQLKADGKALAESRGSNLSALLSVLLRHELRREARRARAAAKRKAAGKHVISSVA